MAQELLFPHEGPDAWTNDEWATPWEVVRALELEFGPFELDPCCTAETAKAPRFFTKRDNGLTRRWAPLRTFCNPPYSQKGPWLQKAYEESQQGALVVVLVPARTDAAWFHDWILGKAELRFHRTRVHFLAIGREKAPTRPMDGTMFAIYRPGDHRG